MKTKLRYVLLITILIFGFFLTKKIFITDINPKVVNASDKVINQSYDLKIIKAANDLRLGEMGSITIQGRPGVRYTIIAYYSLGKEPLEAKQQRTTDEFGQATFLWTVSEKTVPGTYLVTITGDGRTINAQHTVIE